MQGKTYTPNFLDHKQKDVEDKNLYIVRKGTHEAIIEKEYFERVQQEIQRRANINYIPFYIGNEHGWLNSKVKCGLCGGSYVANYSSDKNGNTIRRWLCGTRVNQKKKKEVNEVEFGCSGSLIKDAALEQGVKLIFEQFIVESDFVRQGLLSELDFIKNINATEDAQKEIKVIDLSLKKIETRKKNLMDRLVDGVITKEEYGKYNDGLNSEIAELDKKKKTLEEVAEVDFTEQVAFLENCVTILDSLSESDEIIDKRVLSGLVSKIEIFPERIFKVFLLGMDRGFKLQYKFIRQGNNRNLDLEFLGVE